MGQMRKASRSYTFTAIKRIDEDAFQINHPRNIRNDFSFEFYSILVDPNPHSSLLYPAKTALSETSWINLKRVYSNFFKSQLCMSTDDRLQIINSGQAEVICALHNQAR